jgi:probable phosphoglycerate mutase
VPEPRAFPQLRFRRPPGSVELVLVRHGESVPAVEGEPFALRDGQGDPPLSALGRQQADAVAARLASRSVDAIYVSTLQRTAQTAAPLAAVTGLVPIVDADLREVHLGEWEGGRYRQKILDGDPTAQQALREERWDAIPGAEPAEAFAARVRASVQRIAAAHRDQLVVCVTHGGVIGQLLAEATGARPFAFVGNDNGAISVLVVTDDRWVLRCFNDTSHLERAAHQRL